VERAYDTGEKKYACRHLVGKPEGKYPVGKPMRKCDYNIEMGLKEIVWHGVGWIRLAQYRDT
jgi:hypothetical protein